MARPKSKAPARRYHLSGQSIVTLDGRDYYLGVHDSPESIARYAVLISIYQAGGLKLPEDFDPAEVEQRVAVILGDVAPQTLAADQSQTPILVRHVTASYMEHAAAKYAGNKTEQDRMRCLCRDLDEADGDLPAEEYGPRKLQAQRERWVASGKSRVYINTLTNATRRIWRFAVAQELVTATAWERLRSVEPLRRGQTSAPETEPVLPADIGHVRATAKHLSPVVRDMLRVQLATGCRPSEICNMRPLDIDRSGDIWIYRPPRHKTASRGKLKEIPLVGDARAAVTDYLNRPAEDYCFSPREAVAWLRSVRTANRKTPASCGNTAGSSRKQRPQRQPGNQYDSRSYRQAIHRAADAAGVPRWSPYQIRHLVATMIRDALGIDHATAALGHSKSDMTQHYAKLSLDKAIEAAAAAPKL